MRDFVTPYLLRVALKPLWPRGADGEVKSIAIAKYNSPSEVVMTIKLAGPEKRDEERALATARFTVRIHNQAVRQRLKEQARARITKQQLRKEHHGITQTPHQPL